MVQNQNVSKNGGFRYFFNRLSKKCPKRSAAEVQIIAFPYGALIFFVTKKCPRMWPGRVIVRTSLSDELYFFQWPKNGPGSSRVEPEALQLAELLANTFD